MAGRSLNPASFKAGGGLFDDVDAVITQVRYTDEAPEGYTAQGDANPLFALLGIQIDGAEAAVTQHISLGGKSGNNFSVINDGKGLEPLVDDAGISDKAKYAMFISSLVNEGFPGDRLESDDFDPTPIEGTRVHLNRVPTGFDQTFGNKRKGKDGKEYGDTALVVTKIHYLPEDAPAVATKGAKANGKAASSKLTPKAQAASASNDLEDQALTTLKALLAENGTFKRQQITLLANKELMKDKNRTPIVKIMFSEEFLSAAEGIVYDKKKGTVSLA